MYLSIGHKIRTDFWLKAFFLFIGYDINSWQHQYHQATVQIQKKETKNWCEKDYKNYSITSDYIFTQ